MNIKTEKPTQIAYELHLNKSGIPENLKKSNGGNVPDFVKYGTWMRINDADAFTNGYKEWREKQRQLEEMMNNKN